jgi:hypothetical protein
MPTAELPSAGVLRVRVADDLILDAGSWHLAADQDQRPAAIIEPPATPMIQQLVAYLEAKPAPPEGNPKRDDEARAATAVCLRWGSYFALLADPVRPPSPSIDDEQASQIGDEMARTNVEILATLEWWFGLCRMNDRHYFDLAQRGVAYLPVGPRTIHPHLQAATLLACTMKDLAAEVRRTRWTGQIDQDLATAGNHGIRVIANTVTLQAWRNGRSRASMPDASRAMGWTSGGCPPRWRRRSSVTPRAAFSPGSRSWTTSGTTMRGRHLSSGSCRSCMA